MPELHVAAHRLTAQLADRMAQLLAMRGLPFRTYVNRVDDPPQVFELVTTAFDLPAGQGGAILVPRDRPEPDDASWIIDVSRTDGLCREAWSEGVAIRPRDARRGSPHVLWLGDSLAAGRVLDGLIDELARPLQGAERQAIFKLWKLRFGAMPPAAVGSLERTADVDLDQLESAVLSAAGEAEASEAAAHAAEASSTTETRGARKR